MADDYIPADGGRVNSGFKADPRETPDGVPLPRYSQPVDKTPPPLSTLSRLKQGSERASAAFSRHKHTLRLVAGYFLLLLYFAYLIYALWYNFRAAVPLLVMTVIAVGGVVYGRLLAPVLEPRVERLVEKVRGHLDGFWGRRYLGWVIGGCIFLALLVFVIVDAQADYRRLISLLGIFAFLLIALCLSTNPTKVRWRPVVWGMGLQFLFGLLIIRWDLGAQLFAWLGERINIFLGFTDAGTAFVYGFTAKIPPICQLRWAPPLAFMVFPIIIFFSSCVSVLYYYGAMQWLVQKMAVLMQVTLGTTAAESLNSAGNVFLGMTEAPLLIQPYMAEMTDSELNAVMTGGFSTIAGSVFGVYVSFGACANHLLSASVMSAPAALAIAKLIHPETAESKTKKVSDLKMDLGTESNALEAAAKGACQAIFLVANICANLIAFLAILAFVNAVLAWLGVLVGVPGISLELILSYVFYPLAWLMGASNDHKELLLVAELMGTKTVLNEFIAYEKMGKMISDGLLSSRAQLISTYALCGFSNIASMGITLGALGGMCPAKQAALARLYWLRCAVRALIAGSIACFLTACVAGLLSTDLGSCARAASTGGACLDLKDIAALLNVTLAS